MKDISPGTEAEYGSELFGEAVRAMKYALKWSARPDKVVTGHILTLDPEEYLSNGKTRYYANYKITVECYYDYDTGVWKFDRFVLPEQPYPVGKLAPISTVTMTTKPLRRPGSDYVSEYGVNRPGLLPNIHNNPRNNNNNNMGQPRNNYGNNSRNTVTRSQPGNGKEKCTECVRKQCQRICYATRDGLCGTHINKRNRDLGKYGARGL